MKVLLGNVGILLYLLCVSVYALPPLQLYVELTAEGGILKPPPGHYSGPVVISRAITIDGQGQVTLDGEGSGTVLDIKADGSVVRGLHITASGDSFDHVDAGILIEADHTLVEDNQIDNVLFGIHLSGANDNTLRGNQVSSKDASPSLRGEGLRLWYSHDNLIENNNFQAVRDIFITNSVNNRLLSNHISNSRVGFQLVFAHENEIAGNSISQNGTGILMLYSNDLIIRNNKISHVRGYSGTALAFKESNNVIVEGNEILHCSVGLSANAPLDPENTLSVLNNHFIYNDVALYFYGEKGGHIIQGNRFEQNMKDVLVSAVSTGQGNV